MGVTAKKCETLGTVTVQTPKQHWEEKKQNKTRFELKTPGPDILVY